MRYLGDRIMQEQVSNAIGVPDENRIIDVAGVPLSLHRGEREADGTEAAGGHQRGLREGSGDLGMGNRESRGDRDRSRGIARGGMTAGRGVCPAGGGAFPSLHPPTVVGAENPSPTPRMDGRPRQNGRAP